jgi:hypothetical protein
MIFWAFYPLAHRWFFNRKRESGQYSAIPDVGAVGNGSPGSEAAEKSE